MATIHLPIFGWSTIPGSSGEAFFETYSVKATNDRWDRLVAIFNDAASPIEVFGGFRVPQDYAGSASVLNPWTSTAITGSVVYRFLYRPVAETESFDQTSQTENASVAVSSPSAVNLRQDATMALISANFSAGDEVQFEFMRNPIDGSDDMAAAAIVFGLYFGYQDS